MVLLDLIDNVLAPEEICLAPLRDFCDHRFLYHRQDVVLADNKPAVRCVLDPHVNHLIAINQFGPAASRA